MNEVIANPNSHDTSLAGAYVALSEVLGISNIDTIKFLCEYSQALSEKSLKNHNTLQVKTSLLNSLAASLNNLGYLNHYKGQFMEALDYFHRSLKLREEIGDKIGIVSSLNNIGAFYQTQGQLKEALEYYQRGLIISEEIDDKSGIAYSLNNIGFIYNGQGQIKEALDYYHRSLKIREEIKEKKGIADALNSIGFIYSSLGKVKEALDYYHRSLIICEEIGDKYGKALSLNNIGNIYLDKVQLKEALEYFQSSLKIQEEIGNEKGLVVSLNNIGAIYYKQGQLNEALDYFSRGLKINEETGIKEDIAYSLNYIGVIYFDQGQLKEAFIYEQKSLALARELGYIELIKRASILLTKIYKKQGKGIQALEMYELYISMRDSIDNEETQKAAIQQQAKYEYEKAQAVKDKEHEKQLAIEQERQARQKVVTYATASGLGLVGIFLFFVMNRLRVTRKQKVLIEKQKEEVEEAHQEIKDSIAYAKRIQSAILPPNKVVKEYLQESFILYKPKDVVAGDFYWLEHKDNKVLFAAADCTGHGVPGAMVSVVCNNGLNRSVREHSLTEPGKILDKTREIVIQEFEKSEEEVKDGMDIALCSLEGNKLQYAGANNPLWIIREGELIETKANKQPIGKFDNLEPYTTHSFELQKGDSIYIFSDGYVDQFGGEKGKKLKAKAFRELLLSIQDKSMEDQKQIIDKAFETWKGDLEQIDDVCVIGVRF